MNGENIGFFLPGSSKVHYYPPKHPDFVVIPTSGEPPADDLYHLNRRLREEVKMGNAQSYNEWKAASKALGEPAPLPTGKVFDEALRVFALMGHENEVLGSSTDYTRGMFHGLLRACVVQVTDEPYSEKRHDDLLGRVFEQVRDTYQEEREA